MASALDELLARLSQAEQGPGGPPLDKWHPPLSGDIDIRIAADGRWYHEGDLIARAPLVKLFSSILRREGDDYFLVTPVEKWRIRVDDLPFVAHSVARIERDGVDHILFTTNVGDEVLLDRAHPLEVETLAGGEPRPSMHVRANLWARIDRPSFYQLVDWARTGTENGQNFLHVDSAGQSFTLGSI
jgi:uncharacterized protein